jgi:hypothetical protein
MSPFPRGLLALGLWFAPTPAFSFTPMIFLSAIVSAAVGAGGGAALSGAGIGPAGQAVASAPASPGSVRSSSVQRRSTYASGGGRRTGRKLTRR